MYICECGKNYEKAQSLNAHYSHCLVHRKDKPAINRFKGKEGWSKGLNKHISKVIANIAKKNSLLRTGKKGKPLSDNHKKIISLNRIKFLEENPNSKINWIIANNGTRDIKVQGKWEKDVADWLNVQKIKWDRKRICYDTVHHYTPDFWLPDLNFYIEVKGWMKDSDIVKMNKVIEQTGIDIKILDSNMYKKLSMITIFDLKSLGGEMVNTRWS